MANPLISIGSRLWFSDHSPTSVETVESGVVEKNDLVIDNLAGGLWVCTDPTANAMVWVKCGSPGTMNTTRSYSSPVITMNNYRVPNTSYDTQVFITIRHASTLILPAEIDIYINNSVWKSELGISGIAATIALVYDFVVPLGQNYKIMSSSGSNTIVDVKELSS